MNDDMPQGWISTSLGTVANIIMGQSPPSTTYNRDGEGLPFFQGKAEFGPLYPTPEKYCSTPQKVAEPGDVLISVRAPVGPTNLCRELSCIGRGLAALRVSGEIPSLFLFYYLRSIEEVVSLQGTGSTFTAINSAFLRDLRFYLPPINEQRRIVAKLEKLLEKVDSCQKRLAKILILLKRFRQVVLEAACSGRLTEDWREQNPGSEFERHGESPTDNEKSRSILAESCLAGPSDWIVRDLRSLITNLDQGWSPKCHIERSTSPGVWGVIKTTAVQALEFIERENKRLPETLTPRVNLELREGDLLITRAGPRARAGVCCLIRQVRPRLMICDKVYRFRVNETRVLAQFLVLALNTPSMIEHIDTLKTGISDSGVNLTQDKFLNLTAPIPPILEQREIVRRVDELFTLADQVEARYAKAKEYVDKLKQSILAKAFRGELVPQDPNDEPASALLERIREARTTQPANRSRRRANSSKSSPTEHLPEISLP